MSAAAKSTASSSTSSDNYKAMRRIREIESALTRAYDAGDVPGLLHPCYGGEALAVGVAACLLGGKDMIFSSHRCHGHALAGGIDAGGMIREIMGRLDGINGGHAGTQHLNDPDAPENGSLFISGNGIVGAQVPLALGAALSARNKQTGGVAVVFFGDGAMNQGGVMEAFNLAAVQRLPVVFICENNGLAQSTRASSVGAGQLGKGSGYSDRAAAFALDTATVNGRDLVAVKSLLLSKLDFVRAGNPLFIEADIDRLSGHYYGDEMNYLDDSLALESATDPLILVQQTMDKAEVKAIDQAVKAQIKALFQEAMQ